MNAVPSHPPVVVGGAQSSNATSSNPANPTPTTNNTNGASTPPGENPADLTLIGSYYLSKVLGKGSYAVVKLGIHKTSGQSAAVKIISKSAITRSPNLVRRVQREVALLRIMSHPNVTKFIEFMETKQYLIIVMEYVPGGDLFHYLKKSTSGSGLPTEVAFRFFYQILSGLEYCHSCGIAHRDIKPENILMDEAQTTVKLTDFGMANIIKDRQLMETSCGSPHYAAPEVIRGEKYSGSASDVWSLGVVLFGMCAGRLPFNNPNIPKLLELVCRGYYMMPLSFSHHLRDLIVRMLHPLPKQRITLSRIKKHPWWLLNCAALNLNPNGISTTVSLSFQPSTTTSNPINTTTTASSITPGTFTTPGSLGVTSNIGVVGGGGASPPLLKLLNAVSAAGTVNAVAMKDPQFDEQPITEHPLLKMDISSTAATELVELFAQLRALTVALLEENQTIRTLYEQEMKLSDGHNSPGWNQEEVDVAIPEPFDAEIIEFIVEHQGWTNHEDLKRNLRSEGSNMEKAYYKLLQQQKCMYGSLVHLTAAQPAHQSPTSSPRGPRDIRSVESSSGPDDQYTAASVARQESGIAGQEETSPRKTKSFLGAIKRIFNNDRPQPCPAVAPGVRCDEAM